MVVVAIAGSTGGDGRTVLDAISKAGEHKAIVLSRTVSSPMLSLQCNNIKLKLFRQQMLPQPTDRDVLLSITIVDQMKHVLQENNVECVVSALLLLNEGVAQSQINLIRAAVQSGTVTKFIPSEHY